MLTEGFLSAHPDLRWRREGIRSLEKGEASIALQQFKRAARHADKPSQAMVADLYWRGEGVSRDRAEAYVWMDLAAERLYPDFVMFRERYWMQMSEAERASALERGEAVYAEYGDDVAKPRLERILSRERRKVTGSRAGFVGALTIIPNTGPMAGTGMSLNAEQYYADKYWKPEAYWALHDALWREPAKGRADVGELQPLRGDGARDDD